MAKYTFILTFNDNTCYKCNSWNGKTLLLILQNMWYNLSSEEWSLHPETDNRSASQEFHRLWRNREDQFLCYSPGHFQVSRVDSSFQLSEHLYAFLISLMRTPSTSLFNHPNNIMCRVQLQSCKSCNCLQSSTSTLLGIVGNENMCFDYGTRK